MTGFLTPTHILLLLLVALLLFGAKRLPELGRSLGSGLREFRHSVDLTTHHEPTALTAGPGPDAHLRGDRAGQVAASDQAGGARDTSTPPAV